MGCGLVSKRLARLRRAVGRPGTILTTARTTCRCASGSVIQRRAERDDAPCTRLLCGLESIGISGAIESA
eukprot:3957995-Pleurochrysis_carterae.AAC.1